MTEREIFDGGRPPEVRRVELVGAASRTAEIGRQRLAVAVLLFAAAFLVLAGRLIDVGLLSAAQEPRVARADALRAPTVARAAIVDRHGVVLATNLPTQSLYANPSLVIDPEEAAERLAAVLPEFTADALYGRLTGAGRFVWIKRGLTPRQQASVNALGIPGLSFIREERRVYPHGALAAHVVGFTSVDNRGLAGLERAFDEPLVAATGPVTLSLDLRVQHVVHDELAAAVAEFDALGGTALVLDVDTGEILALVSLPDFDPHSPGTATADQRFNRATLGVYEMGSTFKVFTAAMALDAGVVTINGGYDASEPMRVSRFTIRDFRAKNRWLSVPEILVYSSNIGAAKMALDVGGEAQQEFLNRLGMLRQAAIELPETARPMVPSTWREINIVTAAYGHGIAVTPLHLASGFAAMVNGGVLRPATLLRQDGAVPPGERVVSAATSMQMRALLRLVVAEGTGRSADAAGYLVGGKTGTAEKNADGRYNRKALISSFIGAFPINEPRYAVLAMIDEPKGNKSTHGFATGGWTAAPAVGRIIARIGPMLGVMPKDPGSDVEETLLVEVRAADAAY